MATLHIRDVPEAAAVVGRELAHLAARPSNAEIVERLKSRDRRDGPSTADILEAVTQDRR